MPALCLRVLPAVLTGVLAAFAFLPSVAHAALGESATPTAEARLAADPDTLWMATFETPDWKRHWGADQDAFPEKTRVHQPAVADEGNVLDVTLGGPRRDPDKYGMAIRANFSRMGIGTLDEAYLRYRIYIPADFDFSDGGKLPGLSGLEPGTAPTDVSAGGEFNAESWSGRLYFMGDGGLTSYLYVKHAAGQTISNSSGRYVGISARAFTAPKRNQYKTGGTTFRFRTGTWSTIEIRYRMNTPGANDGIYQTWVDGRLVSDLDDVQYRQAGHSGLGINQFFATTFYGGPEWSKRANHLLFDDVVISRSYVGLRDDSPFTPQAVAPAPAPGVTPRSAPRKPAPIAIPGPDAPSQRRVRVTLPRAAGARAAVVRLRAGGRILGPWKLAAGTKGRALTRSVPATRIADLTRGGALRARAEWRIGARGAWRPAGLAIGPAIAIARIRKA